MDEVTSAGPSSQAEYQRRLAAHRDRIRRRRPWLLGLGAAIVLVGLAFMGSQPLVGWTLLIMAAMLVFNVLFVVPNHSMEM